MNISQFIIFNLFTIINFFLIVQVANKLKFFSKFGTFGFGLFWLLWCCYLFVLQPLLGPSLLPEKYSYPSEIYLFTQLVISIFLFFNLLGVYYIKGRVIHFPIKNFSLIDRINTKTNLFLISVLIYFICKTYYDYGTLNLIDALLMRSQFFGENFDSSNSVFTYLFDSFLTCCISLLIFSYISKEKIFISLLITILVCYIYLFSGSKYALVWFFYWAAAFSIYKKGIPIKFFLPIISFAILMVPLVNLLRSGAEGGSVELMATVLLERSDFFWGLSDLINHLDSYDDYSYGFATVAIFMRFIPRSIFPERPGSVEAVLTYDLYSVDGWIFAFGGIGEFYYSYSLFGVAFIGFISGCLIKLFNNSLLKAYKNGNYITASFLVVSPVWNISWAIGVNTFFGIKLLMWLCSSLILIVIISTLTPKIIKKNDE